MSLLRLDLSGATYLSYTREGFIELLGDENVHAVSWDGGFDFAAVSQEVLEVLYEAGGWNRMRHQPGVRRLLESITRGELPYLVIWRRLEDGTPIPVGMEFGDQRFELTGSTKFYSGKLGLMFSSYKLCTEVWDRRDIYMDRDRLPESFRELVRTSYVPWVTSMFGDEHHPESNWSDTLYASVLGADGATCRVIASERAPLRAFAETLRGVGFAADLGDGTMFPQAAMLRRISRQWEWIVGTSSPVLALVPEAGTFRMLQPETSSEARASDMVFVVCCGDEDVPVFRRIREVFDVAAPGSGG